MPQRDDKRLQRELKRQIKRAGNKRRRRGLKEDLAKNPEEAAFSDESFGRHSSEPLNGSDNDSTRRDKETPSDDTSL